MKKKQSGYHDEIFSILGALGISVTIAWVLTRFGGASSPESTWEVWVYRLMFFWIIFIAVRTLFLILFSFADRYYSARLPELKVFPVVSVLIPCFNEELVVEKALESAYALDYPNLEILLIDDGSTDQTLSRAETWRSQRAPLHHALRILSQPNTGKYHALNHGLAEASGEFVLCVDADSTLDPSALREGLPHFFVDPQVGAVAGQVRVSNRETGMGRFQALEYMVGLNFHKSAQSFMKSVMIVPGPVGLFRRQLLLDLGGYRSNSFAEDCEMTIRLLMSGFRVVYHAGMIAHTEVPEDFRSLLQQRYRWSRGTLQAISVHSNWVFQPWKSLRNFLILSYFWLETALIPTANFVFAILFLEHAVLTGRMNVLGPYFIQLTLLDGVLTVYSLFAERGLMGQLLLSMVNRLTYGLSLEVVRFFSMLDEVFGLPMNWGKLVRRG